LRLLYFGDKHERVTAPENRLDVDYQDTQRRKTLEIIDIGKKYGVSAYLQPGDFLDSPNPPLDYVADVMRLWTGDVMTNDIEQFENKMPPLVGLAGNHELFGNNLKTLPKTMIGFLNRLGMMHFATKEKPYFLKTEDGATVAITGTHYHLDIDSPEHIDDYIVKEKLGDFHIHIVHGYLSDKSKGDMFAHTLIDHIRHTKADVTISGHDHIGFPLTEVDGKWFVNPGAIPRMSNDLKEMKRKPKVLLMDITKAEGIKFKEIYLKSAQDGELVLNRKKITERKKREERIAEFKKAVKDAGITKSTDIVEIIRALAISKGMPLSIRDNVVDRISAKKQEMSQVFEGIMKDAYVDRIVLENFQSHEYTDLELSRGLNIFVGESRQGKTAVLRAFQWVYENKPTGKRVVKIGTDCAKVTVYLSNGYIITRIMETKRSGKNGYEITDPLTGEVAYHNTKILPEVQKILGYNPFVIDSDLQFNLNFMKQGAGWFLIGDHFSAPLKAKIIGAIYGTHYADAVARELEAEDRKVNEELKRTQTEVQRLEEQVQKYVHLDDLETTISEVEGLLKKIDELSVRKEKILVTLTKRKELEKVVGENEEIISYLSQIHEANLLLEHVRIRNLKRIQLATLIHKRKETQTKYTLLEESLKALRDIESAKVMFEKIQSMHNQSNGIRQSLTKKYRIVTQIQVENEIIQETEQIEEALILLQEVKNAQTRRSDLVDKAERAKRLEQIRKEVSSKLTMIKETLEKTEHIEEARKWFNNFSEKMNRKSNIEKMMIARKRVKQQVDYEVQQVKNQKNEIAVLVNKYQSLLEKAGSCPVCHGTIDKVTVDRIVNQHAVS
jgi:exonuclease SbcC